MASDFEVIAGTTVGKDHRRSGRNNQDAYCIARTEAATVAMVADGCGSGKHSEVGAKIGVREAARVLASDLEMEGVYRLEAVRTCVLRTIDQLVTSLGDDYRSIISEYFLFTLLGVVITPEISTFFSIGDGIIVVNGEVMVSEYPNNAPPYIAYDLISNDQPLPWRIQARLPTELLRNFVLGTDGLSDLIAAEDRTFPGKDSTVGPLDLLWEDPKFWKNPDALNRHLALVNKDMVRVDREQCELERHHGLLSDDTTLIVGRRSS